MPHRRILNVNSQHNRMFWSLNQQRFSHCLIGLISEYTTHPKWYQIKSPYLKSFKNKLNINWTLECDVVHHKIESFVFKHCG